MKVEEVIKYLQKLDPSLDVFIHNIDFDEIYEIVNIRSVESTVRFQFTEDEPT